MAAHSLASNGPQISDSESTNVVAVLNAQIRSVDENGNVSHCHCKRFITAECGSRTPMSRIWKFECCF